VHGDEEAVDPKVTAQLLTHFIAGFHTAPPSVQKETASYVVPTLKAAGREQDLGTYSEQIGEAVDVALAFEGWEEGEQTRSARVNLHALVAAVGDAVPEVSDDLGVRRRDDLVRALAQKTTPLAPFQGELRTMALDLGRGLISDVLAAVPRIALEEDPPTAIALLRTRLALEKAGARTRKRTGKRLAQVSVEEIVTAARSTERGRLSVVTEWITLQPPPAELVRVAGATRGRVTVPMRRALRGWADRATQRGLTAALEGVLAVPFGDVGWIESLTGPRADYPKLTRKTTQVVSEASNWNGRMRGARRLSALKPVGFTAQREVADLAIGLFNSRRKSDLQVGLVAVRGLGTDHRAARRLSAAVRKGCEHHSYVMTRVDALALATAKIDIPRGCIADSAKDWLRQKGVDL
jgi:hypothetical protein